MNYRIEDLIDIEKVQALLDGFLDAIGIGTALLDLEGSVLASAGWQDICTKFHRVGPESAKRCTKSDTALANALAAGTQYSIYKCLNGMIDIVMPIIVGDERVGNLFTGQFFFNPPDREKFRCQAQEYGFDEGPYLEALARVPIIPESKIKAAVGLLLKMTGLMAEMGLERIKQLDTETALKASEERYRVMTDDMPVLVCCFLPGGEISYVNKAYCTYFQKTAEELIGMNFSSLIPKADRETVMANLSELTVDSATQSYEHQVIVPEVEIRWQRWTYRALFNINAEIISYQSVGEDITDRKRAEEELVRVAGEWQKTFNSTNDAIWVISQDHRILRSNKVACELFRRPKEDIIGKHCWEIVHPTEETYPECPARRAKVSLRRETMELEVARRWFQVTVDPILDATGKYDGAVHIIRDITERKRAQEEVNSLAKFPNENPNPILRVAGDGRIIYANMGSRVLLDYWKTGKDEPLPEQWRERCEKVLASNQLESFEEKTEDNIFLLTLTPFVEMGYVNIYGLDITKRKQAEEELSKYREHLEELVKARTAELEAFSHSVSHDLRAPLRAMDGFSQAVLDDYADKLDAQGKDFLNRVRSASQKMGRLIDDLLKLARISRSELGCGKVNLSARACSIARDLQAAEPERDVEFLIEDELTVEGDNRLLRLLLVNLLGNAWKFTSEKKKARIEVGRIDRDGKQVYFVRDNGAGFEMKYSNKLFGPFQRLHSEKEFPGSGIGLATVRRIVSRHGGEVWAEGAVGKGATIYFTLNPIY